MSTTTKLPPVWINIPDLIVQVSVLLWAFEGPSDDNLALVMCVGGGWQLLSQYIHWKTGFAFSKNTHRKLHIKWALCTLGIVAIDAILFWAKSLLIFFAGYLSLALGIVLYFYYMIICMKELYELEWNNKQSTKE